MVIKTTENFYLIINKRTGKRAINLHGKMTPIFDYACQAQNYLDRHFAGSKALTVWKLNNAHKIKKTKK